MLIAACTSSSSSTTSTSSKSSSLSSPILKGSGTVNVLYAGSLVTIFENDIAKKFDAASGFSFSGFAGGSSALANQMSSGLKVADVFVSASPAVDNTLMSATGPGKITWYITFASAPLVIAYNPKSKFANQFKTKPWQNVITEPGILLGRTDPQLDPKGVLTVDALDQASRDFHSTAILNITNNQSTVFPEETLIGRLSAGQLDAGFFYSNEAKAANFPTVSLAPLSFSATYTITIPSNANNTNGATSFVQYLLSTTGKSILTNDGLSITTPPKLNGDISTVPKGIANLAK